MQPKPKSNVVKSVFQIVLIGLLVFLALNYQEILDQYALQTYHPSAAVAQIQGRLALTRKATATLYRADPKIDQKTDFNSDCDTKPHELELGCFYQGRIYVLQIDNSSLAPEMDVVTAHELLHGVWSQMSSDDRQTLGAELQRVYALVANDELKQRMAGYAQSEPGQENNELHSILGTEFAHLSPLLETHYAKYFSDRQQIVQSHMSYQNVFSSRKTELETELAQIRAEKGQLAVLNQQLEKYKSTDQIALYNSLVPRQNRMVDDINKSISAYRQGVDEYNALSKSLDSQEITDTESSAQ
jgi:hypothetical protein